MIIPINPSINTENKKATVFACSGSANVGQLSNHCALVLEREGRALFACIASVGCHEEKMLQLAKGSHRIVALDGCPISCCSRTLEHAGIKVDAKMTMTDIGIEKDHGKVCNDDEAEKAISQARRLM